MLPSSLFSALKSGDTVSDEENSKEDLEPFYEVWSKCSFCGRRNGLFGRSLEQHTTRCLYKGDANSTAVSVPNYSKCIEEDDKTFLPMLWAHNELPVLKKKLERVEKENEFYRVKLIELGVLKEEKKSSDKEDD